MTQFKKNQNGGLNHAINVIESSLWEKETCRKWQHSAWGSQQVQFGECRHAQPDSHK